MNPATEHLTHVTSDILFPLWSLTADISLLSVTKVQGAWLLIAPKATYFLLVSLL